MRKKTSKFTETPQKAAVRLLNEKHDFYKSWAAVGEELRLNKGLVNLVGRGKRKAPASVLRALGLPLHKPPKNLTYWSEKDLAKAIRERR